MADRLYFYPDYRSTNDYQSMLYSGLENAVAVAGTLDDAIEFSRYNPNLNVTFHLHWPEPLFAGIDDADKFRMRAEYFIVKIRLLQAMNGRVFWTIHNKLPHDQRFVSEYIFFHQQLADHVDIVFVHSESARHIVGRTYKLPSDRTVTIPHGSYSGIYPNLFGKRAARERLGLSQEDIVIGFVGQLRPYKGLDTLISAFRQLRQNEPNVSLLIAGKPTHPTKPGEWSAMQNLISGLRVDERFVPVEELSLYFSAVDFIALPYVDILTSGSVMLATSFSKPLILPRLPTLMEFSTSGFTLMYEAGDAQSLFTALKTAIHLSPSEIEQMEGNSRAVGEALSWRNVAPRFARVVENRDLPGVETIADCDIDFKVRFPKECAQGGIGVCIVNYFSTDDTIALARDIELASDDHIINVYVLDNSRDIRVFQKLCRLLPNAVVCQSEHNLGYASGNNFLVRLLRLHARGFALIVNPDVRIEHDLFERLLEFGKLHPNAILSPAVLKEDGTISFAGAFFTEGMDLEVRHFLDGQSPTKLGDQPYKVDALNGCIMFFSLDTYDLVGPIPEDYFLYYEETEWFKTAAQKEVELWIVPLAKATHSKASHGTSAPSLYYLYYLIRGNSLFSNRFGRSVEGAQQRLQSSFIAGWRKRLSASCPTYLRIFEAVVKAALEDGVALIRGAIDLGMRIDLASNDLHYKNGFIEEIKNDGVTYCGWVTPSLDAPLQNVPGLGVWLIVNDVPITFSPVSVDRPDVKAIGYPLRSGFQIDVPEEFHTGDLLKVEIRSASTGGRLPFVQKGHEPRLEIRILPPVMREATPAYDGRVEGIRDAKLEGWIWDKANPSRTVYSKVRISSEILSIGPADTFRIDLREAGKGNGKHAFAVPLPKRMLQSSDIHVELLSSDESQVIHKKVITHNPVSHGYSNKFSYRDYLQWAYVEDRMPVGAYDTSIAVQRQFNVNYKLYSRAAEEAGHDVLVSVIMPVFNRASLVSSSIISVVSQSYSNWELIVIDDGSSDGTGDEIAALQKRLNDPRIRLETHKENRGVSAARNTGLNACSGEFICYLDSDNLWKSSTLAIMVNELAMSPRSVAAYAGQEVWERLDSTDQVELRFIRAAPFNRSKLEYRNYIDLNVFMHRRSCLERYGMFREDMKRLVDWELIVRYTRNITPKFVPVLLSEYFVNQTKNQITRVENYRVALAKLLDTVSLISNKCLNSGHSRDHALVVLVYENSVGELLEWIHLNASWVIEYKATVLISRRQSQHFSISALKNIDDVLFRQMPAEEELMSLEQVYCIESGLFEIVITSTNHIAQHGWRSVTTRAKQDYGISVASGRLIPFRQSAVPVSSSLVDKMPRLIAKDVVGWEIGPQMLGQRVSSLPVGWVWIDQDFSRTVLGCLEVDTDPTISARIFYEHLALLEKSICAYLPDIVVMQKESA